LLAGSFTAVIAGYGFNGYDFQTNPFMPGATSNQQGISREQCAAMCVATVGCVMYNYGESNGCARCCWLKSRVDWATKASYPGLTSYIGGIGVCMLY
jgi:hypothetical protein